MLSVRTPICNTKLVPGSHGLHWMVRLEWEFSLHYVIDHSILQCLYFKCSG